MREGKRFRKSVYITLSFLFVLWSVKIIENTYQIDLGYMGIKPLTLEGTIGILTGPLVHGDLFHLISNSFPLLILGVTFFYFYERIALPVFGLIYIMTGFWVWLAAREGFYHIGASGIVYGLLSFLLGSGFLRRDRTTLAISFIMLFLYGSTFFMGMLPGDSRVSWESHLMGAVAGLFCAFYFRQVDVGLSQVASSPGPEESTNDQVDDTVYLYHYTPEKKEKDVYFISFGPEEDEDADE
ncbi:rhomboid family intramembrane serine protease [Fulvivirga sedimenti]|uniref:Rhomboid family intramembrane serine protease n=1 Tax=Fulvivirga sedimenti TaxID=2879465 RepID=A0A9X1HM36_9BACT|nr:rhomboid family intramembrane serine protease [Fulvivirga sedimenti]MCA6073343.1 rhomboid family intramembrane serine protease [Fulvivirga sedimenti]